MSYIPNSSWCGFKSCSTFISIFFIEVYCELWKIVIFLVLNLGLILWKTLVQFIICLFKLLFLLGIDSAFLTLSKVMRFKNLVDKYCLYQKELASSDFQLNDSPNHVKINLTIRALRGLKTSLHASSVHMNDFKLNFMLTFVEMYCCCTKIQSICSRYCFVTMVDFTCKFDIAVELVTLFRNNGIFRWH